MAEENIPSREYLASTDVELRDYFEALLKEHQQAIQVADEEREKAASALREQLTLRIESGDANLREHISSQVAQIQASLSSAEKLEIARVSEVATAAEANRKANEARIVSVQREVGLVHEASERAIAKAEAATEKRFESVNEFRAQLSSQTNTFLPREVYEGAHIALEKRIAVLESVSRFQEGREKGVGVSAGVVVTAIGVILTIITIIVIVANVLTKPTVKPAVTTPTVTVTTPAP